MYEKRKKNIWIGHPCLSWPCLHCHGCEIRNTWFYCLTGIKHSQNTDLLIMMEKRQFSLTQKGTIEYQFEVDPSAYPGNSQWCPDAQGLHQILGNWSPFAFCGALCSHLKISSCEFCYTEVNWINLSLSLGWLLLPEKSFILCSWGELSSESSYHVFSAPGSLPSASSNTMHPYSWLQGQMVPPWPLSCAD